MNKERLLRLASRMDKVAVEHFDIGLWHSMTKSAIRPETKVEVDDDGRTILLHEGFCGSTAQLSAANPYPCVLGHGALIREFQEAGLNIEIHETGASVIFKDENGNRYTGGRAGAQFFDIPEWHAAILFMADGNDRRTSFFYESGHTEEITPQQVADALRKYVETDGKSADYANDLYVASWHNEEGHNEEDEDED